jgi:uncharacterized protein (TIGR02444 family)
VPIGVAGEVLIGSLLIFDPEAQVNTCWLAHGKKNNNYFKLVEDVSLWDFVSRVYAIPQVERLTLGLQDEYHLNVNIILWCCWLEREDIRISVAHFDDILINIDSVSQQTVSKLRDVRRVLQQSGNFTKVQALSIKKHILNAEFLMEKVLVQRLQDLTTRFLECPEAAIAAKSSNICVEFYLKYIDIPDAEEIAGKVLRACKSKELALP